MAKHANITVLSTLTISENGIYSQNPISGCIRYNNNEWQYKNSDTWYSFGTGGQEIFFTNELSAVTSGDVSGLYIDETGKCKFNSATSGLIDLSYEITDTVIANDNNSVPSNKAVYEYVNTTVQNNSIKYTAGNNITISEDNKINCNLTIEKVTDFSSITPETSGIYVSNDGDTKLWDGTNWINQSVEVVTEITDALDILSAIPTVDAVKTYVQNNTPEITPSDCVQFIGNEADISANGKIYIIPSGDLSGLVYTKYDDNIIKLSVEAINEIDESNSANDNKLVTSKAVTDYISKILGPIQQQLDAIVK